MYSVPNYWRERKIFKNFVIILLIAVPLFAQSNEQNKFRLGQSYENAAQFKKAAEIYSELHQLRPNNYQYFEALNRVYLRLKDYTSSIELINTRISNYPNDVNGYGLLGNSYYLAGNSEKALEVWERGLEIAPRQEINYRVIANYLIQNRIFEEAVEILRRGKQVSRNAVQFSVEIANILSITMKFKEAAEEYCQLLKKQPQQLNLVKSQILTYIDGKDALSLSIEAIRNFPDYRKSPAIKELLSFLLQQAGSYTEAFEIIAELDESTNKNGAKIFEFARSASAQKQYKEAAKAHRYLFEKYPGSPFAAQSKIGYANALYKDVQNSLIPPEEDWKPLKIQKIFEEEQFDEVLKAYSTLLGPEFRGVIRSEAQYRIGDIYFRRLGKIKEAESVFEKLIGESPISRFAALAHESLAKIKLIDNDLSAAEDQLSKILQNRRNKPEVLSRAKLFKAKIHLWKGERKKAVSLLSQVSAQFSSNEANDAIEISMLLGTAKFDSVNVERFLNAEKLIEQNNFDKALSEFGELAELGNSLMVAELSKMKYSELLVAVGKYSEAVEFLEKVLDNENESNFEDKLTYFLGNVYLFGVKNTANAVSAFEKVLENFPNSLYLDECRKKLNDLTTLESKNL